jgi:hypothetical protein
MTKRAVSLIPLLGVLVTLAGCSGPRAGAKGARPVTPADAEIQREHTHVWVSPKPNRCPDARLPAPGQTPARERARTTELVRGLRPAFRACFERFVDRHPLTSGGSVRLTLGVDCEGRVTRMRALVRNVDRAMTACMMRAALATRFDPPSAGIAVVDIPTTLRP